MEEMRMNTPLGEFKVYDTLTKEILSKPIAITTYDGIAALSTIEGVDGVYLHAIGRRDRYIVLPQVPDLINPRNVQKDQKGNKLWAGDILSNGKNAWVIKFDLLKGIYCTMVEMPDAYNQLNTLLNMGWLKVGDIISNPELLGGRLAQVFL
jgi:hypothetical protein